MRFLLDTDACIAVLNGRSEHLVARMRAHHPDDFGISSVVRAELAYGARRSRHVARNLDAVEAFCAPFRSVAFDDACAEEYGAIRAELEAGGQPIGPNDLMIAATARAHALTLVTANLREFRRVVALRAEDWLNRRAGGEPRGVTEAVRDADGDRVQWRGDRARHPRVPRT